MHCINTGRANTERRHIMYPHSVFILGLKVDFYTVFHKIEPVDVDSLNVKLYICFEKLLYVLVCSTPARFVFPAWFPVNPRYIAFKEIQIRCR